MDNCTDIQRRATQLRDYLQMNYDDEENPIDSSLSIPKPYMGRGNIKLIVIGQDPTIQNVKNRKNISVTLNLDKQNTLSKYIFNIISAGLQILKDEVYATNLFKYFYTIPPAKTKSVLKGHLAANLQLLKEEISQYPNATIVTLGEPVLQLLAGTSKIHLRNLWGYVAKDKTSTGAFQKIHINNLDRDIFPLPHLPSWQRIAFYGNTISDYLTFIRDNNEI